MITHADVITILSERPLRPLLDVRTPGEFAEGHIGGAISMPLFSDEERSIVGTIYKQQGADKALLKGLEFVGPRMKWLVEQAQQHAANGKVAVHCWRGGKRSGSVAWLLDTAGLDVMVLSGGYKSYRNFILEYLDDTDFELVILGGRTGSRKTAVLHELRELGEQVIDLEDLARHKGSAFGWIGEPAQPTTQQFESSLIDQLLCFDLGRRIWIENESKSIGSIYIPDPFWHRMKRAPLIHLDVPLEIRVDHLVQTYTNGEQVDALSHSFEKIARRLGGQHVKAAQEALVQGDLATAARIALKYYDKTYDYNLSVNKAPHIEIFEASETDVRKLAQSLQKLKLPEFTL